MTYECEFQERPAQPALLIRMRTPVGDLPQVLGRAFTSLGQYLSALGEDPVGAPFVAYHNTDM